MSACKTPHGTAVQCLWLFFIWLLVSSLAACMPSGDDVSVVATGTVAAVQPVSLTSTRTPDVVVNAYQNETIVLETGQALKIESPNPDMEWQVDYPPSMFNLLTPPEMVRAPGTAGWLFQAVAAGEGQSVLTSIVSCDNPPCPLMPMRFQLNVQVR